MHGTLRFMDSILYGFITVIMSSESMQLTPCATKTVFRLVIMQDFQSFGYLAYTCITYDLNYSIVYLSERYENRSRKMCGHGVFVNQRSEDCSLHTVMLVTLFFKGILSEERKLK